jgi:peptidoglycan hydrolase-like protein with peptidoglycan-binding domain
VSRRVLVGGAAFVVVAAAAGIVIGLALGDSGQSSSGNLDNGSPTSLATVTRRTLSSRTLVSATLGYADPATVVEPGGTSPSAVMQAQQSLATAQAQLQTAQSTLATDGAALDNARASRTADRQKQALDCRGDNAAESAPASSSANSGSSSGPCAAATQAAATDEQDVTTNLAKVVSDQRAVDSAQTAVAGAEASLAAAESSATVYGQSSTFTALPKVGQVVARGQTLFEIDGRAVVLLYGRTTAWRAFRLGIAPGRDVGELNANLRALGYGTPAGDAFTSETASAIRAFQAAHGLAQTGELPLGSVAFEPVAVRVTAVTPTSGATVQPGPVLSVTSTVRQVTIALDAAAQAGVKVGDPVLITMPDNTTTPGKVTYVGTVATTPSSDDGNGGGGGDQSPTIEVDVTPSDPAATGKLDQAPVSVAITTASARNALVVPVNALLALAGGGYAVEVSDAGGRHLVGVDVGLFDDAEGLVQVSGRGLAAGRRVVVPGA